MPSWIKLQIVHAMMMNQISEWDIEGNSSTVTSNFSWIRCHVSNERCLNENPWEGTETYTEHFVSADASRILFGMIIYHIANDCMGTTAIGWTSCDSWVKIPTNSDIRIWNTDVRQKVIEKQYFFTFFSNARVKFCSGHSKDY